jgi:hypothetical protein
MTDWDTKAEWMRRVGAIAATWESETLSALTLGPAPAESAPPVQLTTPQELADRAFAEKQRIAVAAASGLRRLNGDNT